MKKIEIQLIGENGNIFNLLSIIRRTLKNLYRETGDEKYEILWKDVSEKIFQAKDYTESLNIIQEHFIVK